jgi:hypothetical protein
MDIVHKIYYGWRDLMDNKSDPRTKNWFMMDSPLPTIAISAGYIFAVKVSDLNYLFNQLNLLLLN